MPGKAAKVVVSERQHAVLTEFSKSRSEQFVAEPDRGDLWHGDEKGHASRQLHVRGGPETSCLMAVQLRIVALAMYVVYQDHLPMIADYPSALRGQAGLDFIIQVPTNWDETRVLHAEVGRCIVVGRRKGDAWVLGGMTAGQERNLDLPLDFLGGKFEAELYLDDAAGGPTAVTVASKPSASQRRSRFGFLGPVVLPGDSIQPGSVQSDWHFGRGRSTRLR